MLDLNPSRFLKSEGSHLTPCSEAHFSPISLITALDFNGLIVKVVQKKSKLFSFASLAVSSILIL